MRETITTEYADVLTLPGPFRSLEQLKRATESIGHNFFSPETMRYFQSRISSGDRVIAGRIIITSERDRAPYPAWDGRRRYTVRVFHDDGRPAGSLAPTDDAFAYFGSLDSARRYVARLLDGKAESFVHEWARPGMNKPVS